MPDVLFVVPSMQKKLNDESLGTLILATVARQGGIDVGIYRMYETDCTDYYSFIDNTVTNILSRNPKIVSFDCRCDTYLRVIRLAEEIKIRNPNIYIVFGGPQADAGAVETIRSFDFVDFCCSGEGETTVVPLFSALLNGEDYSRIDGLCYRSENGDVVQNKRPPMLQNLDESPFVDYSFVPKEMFEDAIKNGDYVALDVGRGCPFNCTYCSTSLFWKRKFRLKSNERIIEEIRILYEDYGIDRVSFSHDMFTGNKKQLLDFCDKLKASGLPILWNCFSRVDTIDEHVIAEMADANVQVMFLGIESGSPRMQKLINKNLDLDRTIRIIKCIYEHNIGMTLSFMYGFPDETEEDVSMTMEYVFRIAEEISPELFFRFHLCTLFQGSQLFEQYKNDLTFAPKQSAFISTFDLQGNTVEFLEEHKDVFPYYFEYRSPLRSKLGYFTAFMHICLDLYKLSRLLFDRYEKGKTINMYFDFVEANKEYIHIDMSFKELISKKWELFIRYAEFVLDSDESDIFKELSRFFRESAEFEASDEKDAVFSYNADISAYLKKASLKDISGEKRFVVANKDDAGTVRFTVY